MNNLSYCECVASRCRIAIFSRRNGAVPPLELQAFIRFNLSLESRRDGSLETNRERLPAKVQSLQPFSVTFRVFFLIKCISCWKKCMLCWNCLCFGYRFSFFGIKFECCWEIIDDRCIRRVVGRISRNKKSVQKGKIFLCKTVLEVYVCVCSSTFLQAPQNLRQFFNVISVQNRQNVI